MHIFWICLMSSPHASFWARAGRSASDSARASQICSSAEEGSKSPTAFALKGFQAGVKRETGGLAAGSQSPAANYAMQVQLRSPHRSGLLLMSRMNPCGAAHGACHCRLRPLAQKMRLRVMDPPHLANLNLKQAVARRRSLCLR